MASTPNFGRVATAMVTPFTPSNEVDVAAAASLASHLVDQGNDTLVINGTTGESPTTTDAEKQLLIRTAVEAVGERTTIVAGVGTNDTSHTLHLAKQAAEAGAHALLVVTPYYNRPPQEGLIQHFTTVADATDLPVMLYDIPGRSGVPIETSTILALAQHPRIVACKDAKGDLWAATEVMTATDLLWFSGDDGATLSHLTNGAQGVVGVTTHIASRQFVAMADAVQDGNLTEALRIHRDLVPAINAVMGVTQGAIAVKAVLAEQGHIPTDRVRLPLPALSASDKDRIISEVGRSGLL